MSRFLAAVSVLALWAGAALASDKLQFAPPAPWVKPAPMPAVSDAPGFGAVQSLLQDAQGRAGPDGQEVYAEVATRLLTPESLAAGNVILPWNPDLSSLTIHKLHIIRGKQVIDVLASQKFTVIRRETNLERAALDGTLTATLQPEGLQVGDIIDLAFTTKGSDPALKGHAEAIFPAPAALEVQHMHLRAVWAPGKPLHWRQGAGVPALKESKGAAGAELDLSLADFPTYQAPAGAPERYRSQILMEVTDFDTWADLSRLMAHLYEKSSVLQSGSSLKAEVARIKAASPDPKVRAAAALQLVQNQVRYLFLGMGGGGYTPAAADLTWTRRFGDCKGKTVLLLGLLRELGIPAEAAVVSTGNGDGLDQHLPVLALFDHVLVRVTLGGKVYWLDGTRTGDASLDALTVPAFHWALPLRTAGAGLEKLDPEPLTQPQSVKTIRIDASGGLDVPATAHLEHLITGDDGQALRTALANVSKTDLDKYARSYWTDQYDWLTPKTWSAAPDAKSGGVRMVVDGTAKMDWRLTDTPSRRYEADLPTPGWKADFHREPGQQQVDAPYAVDYPSYTRTVESITLPAGGAGFDFYGKDLDESVAGRRYVRHVTLDKGVFTAELTVQSLAPEFPASQATAAQARLRDLDREGVYVYAPTTYKSSAAEVSALSAGPATELSAIALGQDLARKHRFAEAIVRYDQALKIEPRSVPALLDRASARGNIGDVAGALSDLNAAIAIEPRNVSAVFMLGAAHALAHQDTEAVADFTHALELRPQGWSHRIERANAYARLHRMDLAQRDVDESLRANPADDNLKLAVCEYYRTSGQYAQYLKLADDWIRAEPGVADAYNHRAVALALLHRRDEARAQYTRSLALKPTTWAYAGRAELELASDLAKASADVAAALKLDPEDENALAIQGKIAERKGDLKGALASLDALVAAHPEDAHVLNNRCYARAAHNIELEGALKDCEAALKLEPQNPAILDSRAFVELRLGKLDAAISDYNATLALRAQWAASLYGRGLARTRRGDKPGGAADLAAARKADPSIEKTFAGYGLTS